MPLQRGEILGYDFNRTVVEFTMLTSSETMLTIAADPKHLGARIGTLHRSFSQLATATRIFIPLDTAG